MICKWELFLYIRKGNRVNTEHKPTLRVLSILELVSQNNGQFKLSDISSRLGIPPGTLSPILHTLREKKYLSFQESSQTYAIGIALFETGSRYIQDSNSYENIVEIMHGIVDKCGETCHFGILDGANVLYLAKVDSNQPIRMYSAIGKRLPAYGTAIGKALLYDYTWEELRCLYPQGLQQLTSRTVTDFRELYRQIQQIKEQGFAYEFEESNEDICCIAVPVRKGGRVYAALSVAMPTFRYDEAKRNCVEMVLKEAVPPVERMIPYLNI